LCEPHSNSVLPPADPDNALRRAATVDAFPQRMGASVEVNDTCATNSTEVGVYSSAAEVSSLETKLFQPEQLPYTAVAAAELTSSS